MLPFSRRAKVQRPTINWGNSEKSSLGRQAKVEEMNTSSKIKAKLVSGAAVCATIALLAGGGIAERAHAAPVAASAASSPLGPPGTPSSFADIVQRVAPAVVSIDVESKADPNEVALDGSPFGGQGQPFGFPFKRTPQQPDGKDLPPREATGSGFFISSDGYIVTNNHVVDGADKITVRTSDDRSLTAHLIGRDAATDLAVIKVDGANFAYVSFEDRAKPRVGDWVIAVGNPFNLGGTATAGIVSALGRPNVSESNYVDFMQIDAPINRGNSGGPTFDLYGRVVGVNTAIFSPSGGSVGIGFDIPADVADQITHQLIASGKVTRGYIGAAIQDVTSDIADSLGMEAKHGALVADTTPGGPSDKAGLRSGDLILRVDGHDVTSAADLTRHVAQAHDGEDIHLEVKRDGKVEQFKVRSGTRPSEAQLASNGRGGPDAGEDEDKQPAVLGMELAPNAKGGVTVRGVSMSSDARQKGLREGDVIVRAGSQKTDSPADVASAADAARKIGRKDVLLLVSRNGRQLFVPVKVAAEDAKG
jgi:serine protease Do